MFITAEILKKYKAYDQDVGYIERFYPNGAEMIDIIRDRHISKEFLHWCREFLNVSEEEFAAYQEACKIVNTEGYWCSQDVRDSKYVVRSKCVNNSIGVFSSSEVSDSTDIIGSENIELSHQIFYSSMVDNSQRVYKGQNIVESSNVCNSTMVVRSKSVIGSVNVFDSTEIIDSRTVTDSHFCKDCNNIAFCLFCDGLENAEYHIFNKPVSQKHYEIFVNQYTKYLQEELEFIKEWPKNLLVEGTTYPTKKFDDWYHPISEKFWKWARTLPGFDSMFLYNITMLPEILID